MTTCSNAVFGLCIYFWIFSISDALLNIEELSNTKYALQILNQPLNENDIDSQGGLLLASRHGQNYYCTLPEPVVKNSESEQDKIPKSTPVGSLLEPLRHEECMRIIKGWWTYEFCYGKHVLQYHMGTNGLKGDTTHLGFYESDFDWNKEALEETMNVKRHKLNRYHSQTYVNGTTCDIIHHNRDTEVRYFCDESSLETYIERVDEPSTCSYILTIKTPYICSHPRTRPILKPKPIDVACQPVLQAKDYMKFEEMAQARKKQAEIEALKRIEQQRIMLQKIWEQQDFYITDEQMGDDLNTHILNTESDVDTATSDISQEDLKPFYRKAAKNMIEMFVNKDQLFSLDPFRQKRLVMDVSDLMRIHKDLPTADQARIIQEYVSRFARANTLAGILDEKSGDALNAGMKDSAKSSPMKKPVKVQLKFHKIGSLDKLKDLKSGGATEDESSIDPAWKKLEDDVTKGLEDAGYQSEDSVFEIRVISTDDSITDGISLSPEEGEKFRQMLMELVSGDTAMTREVERQRSLNDNYNIVWKKDSTSFATLSLDDEESDDIKSYQF